VPRISAGYGEYALLDQPAEDPPVKRARKVVLEYKAAHKVRLTPLQCNTSWLGILAETYPSIVGPLHSLAVAALDRR
jgi:hypothetical protein